MEKASVLTMCRSAEKAAIMVTMILRVTARMKKTMAEAGTTTPEVAIMEAAIMETTMTTTEETIAVETTITATLTTATQVSLQFLLV